MVTLPGQRWLLRLRSSGPQASDVLPGTGARREQVRLYQATVGRLAPLDATPSGTVRLANERGGSVLLTLTLTDGEYTLRVR